MGNACKTLVGKREQKRPSRRWKVEQREGKIYLAQDSDE